MASFLWQRFLVLARTSDAGLSRRLDTRKEKCENGNWKSIFHTDEVNASSFF